MSEPSGGSTQQPDRDSDRDHPQDADRAAGTDRDEVQGQATESVFNDPTAPIWADPTPSMPPMPPAPPTPPGASAYGGPPAASPYGQGQEPPEAAFASNPYAQPPSVHPGQEHPAYGQPSAYGQAPPAPPGQYPAYGQQPYPQASPTNTSAIILTILSALSLCNILTAASLVLGIVALTRNSSDPESSRRLTKIGWIVFAACWGVVLLGLVGVALLAATSGGPSTGSSY